ncbi:MAG: hypothetical protein JW726_10665 [Anaerolineales bacterium]|nr:hypothetical protein [Anaerolineales bacterium]
MALSKIVTENSDFQRLEMLQRNRTKRTRLGLFFVEGVRSITQALLNGWVFEAVIYSHHRRLSDWAEGVIEHAGARVQYELPQRLMDRLSQREETSELMAVLHIPPDDLARIHPKEDFLAVVFDRPASPGNLGALIRSCDALGAGGVAVSGHAVDLYDPETIRAAAGSFFAVPSVRIASYKELIPWFALLKQQLPALQIVGSSAKAALPLHAHNFTPPTVLMIGNETRGLSENLRSLCDAIVSIPMLGSASSLNVACAASILLYEASRQRQT